MPRGRGCPDRTFLQLAILRTPGPGFQRGGGARRGGGPAGRPSGPRLRKKGGGGKQEKPLWDDRPKASPPRAQPRSPGQGESQAGSAGRLWPESDLRGPMVPAWGTRGPAPFAPGWGWGPRPFLLIPFINEPLSAPAAGGKAGMRPAQGRSLAAGIAGRAGSPALSPPSLPWGAHGGPGGGREESPGRTPPASPAPPAPPGLRAKTRRAASGRVTSLSAWLVRPGRGVSGFECFCRFWVEVGIPAATRRG